MDRDGRKTELLLAKGLVVVVGAVVLRTAWVRKHNKVWVLTC